MALAPLVLSVREKDGRTGGDAKGSCPFCGVRLAGGREPFLCEDGWDRACARCHLVRHLERETIDEEAVLVWLPELTQGALNALIFAAHARLAAAGALHLAASPFAHRASLEDRPARAALEAIRNFAARSPEAEARLGTASPRLLGAALMRANPQLYAGRARGLGGIRLMPRGRFFADGRDIYPRLVAGPAHGAQR